MLALTRTVVRAPSAGRFRFPPRVAWAALGVATALAVTAARFPPSGPGAPGPVAVWTADRDASRVFGLDADLFVARRMHVDYPLDVEACRDGGLWVLRSATPSASSSHRLDRFGAGGELITELYVDRTLDLATLDGVDALVIEATGGPHGEPQLMRVREEGSVTVLHVAVGLVCVSGSRDSLLTGSSGGSVARRNALTGMQLDAVGLAGPILDLAEGAAPGGAFVLHGSSPRRLTLLDADLAVRWSVLAGLDALHVSPVRGEERAWLAIGARVRRFGPQGALELDVAGLPLSSLDAVVPWTGGGALVAAPGAILRLDASGALQPGQGGFAWLTDLGLVR